MLGPARARLALPEVDPLGQRDVTLPLTRLVLGSAAAPTYARTTDDGAHIVTSL